MRPFSGITFVKQLCFFVHGSVVSFGLLAGNAVEFELSNNDLSHLFVYSLLALSNVILKKKKKKKKVLESHGPLLTLGINPRGCLSVCRELLILAAVAHFKAASGSMQRGDLNRQQSLS